MTFSGNSSSSDEGVLAALCSLMLTAACHHMREGLQTADGDRFYLDLLVLGGSWKQPLGEAG
ncbi:hypothetical protein JZ751_004579 [Albula glossodonta]|uniref:Uncharacterized protein n=1 Tax=Albula glossodonta TaxID=121402 RepID=A0A8T2N7S1_9TELE|nr:hypothetical protein JZ751_004579 [Albula glossodonta]